MSYSSIKHWADDEKPREKLLKHGRAVLSDAELIGILIGSGTRSKSAIDVARELLQSVDHDLNALARLSIKDLCRINGIGPAKAISITAAIELAQRRSTSGKARERIKSSTDAYHILKSRLQDLNYEQFWILNLSRNHTVLNVHQISDGGVSGTLVDPKRVFKLALEDQASSILLAHNHPSGNLNPSVADKQLTTKMIAAGKALEIQVIDHLIVAHDQYFSFADEGLL